MKLEKRLLAWLLAFAIVFTSIIINDSSAKAANDIEVAGDSLDLDSMDVGDRYIITYETNLFSNQGANVEYYCTKTSTNRENYDSIYSYGYHIYSNEAIKARGDSWLRDMDDALPAEFLEGDKGIWVIEKVLSGDQGYSSNTFNPGVPASTGSSSSMAKYKITPYEAQASVSVEPGEYNAPQSVTLSNEHGAKIYYTTDGTEPTTDSTLYAGEEIAINSNTEIKTLAGGNGTVYGDISTFNYVINPIEGVTVTPDTARVVVGGSNQFAAVVSFSNNTTSNDVSWSVVGNNSSNTSINENGLLSIGDDETASTLTIKATSKSDSSKSGVSIVTVVSKTEEKWENIILNFNDSNDGNTITVVMEDDTVVPADVFEQIAGKDVKVEFDMGNGIKWVIDGKNVTGTSFKDLDLGISKNSTNIPVDVINEVTGEKSLIQIELSYDGEFGFVLTLNVNLEEENAGYYANLFYYNSASGELEYIDSDVISENGLANLDFTHASDYAIIISEADLNPAVTTTTTTTPVTSSVPTTGDSMPIVWLFVISLSALTGVIATTKVKGRIKIK